VSKPPVFATEIIGLTGRKISEAALQRFEWVQFRRNENASGIKVTLDKRRLYQNWNRATS
jgi:hypothetical protein